MSVRPPGRVRLAADLAGVVVVLPAVLRVLADDVHAPARAAVQHVVPDRDVVDDGAALELEHRAAQVLDAFLLEEVARQRRARASRARSTTAARRCRGSRAPAACPRRPSSRRRARCSRSGPGSGRTGRRSSRTSSAGRTRDRCISSRVTHITGEKRITSPTWCVMPAAFAASRMIGRVRRVEGERLLAEQRLARGRDLPRQLEVIERRRADVDGVDLGRGDQLVRVRRHEPRAARPRAKLSRRVRHPPRRCRRARRR